MGRNVATEVTKLIYERGGYMIMELRNKTSAPVEEVIDTNEFRMNLLDAVTAARNRTRAAGIEPQVHRITLDFDLAESTLQIWFDKRYSFCSSLYDMERLAEDIERELQRYKKI